MELFIGESNYSLVKIRRLFGTASRREPRAGEGRELLRYSHHGRTRLSG